MRRVAAVVFLVLLAVVSSVVVGAGRDDSLVAFFPFTGDANDHSGNGNHGTTNNVVLTEDRFGRADQAYFFDGVDGYIEISNSSSLVLTESLTICAWVNLADLSTNMKVILRKGREASGSTDCSYAFYVRSYDELAFYFSEAGGVHETTDVDLDDEVWCHVAVTFDSTGQSVKMYLDGSLVYDQIESGVPVEYDYPMGIGRTNDPGQYFAGEIDEVRVYNRALTEQEIYEDYRSVIFVDDFETGDLSGWD